MLGVTEVLLGLAGLVLLIWYWSSSGDDYWEKLGIPHVKPRPFFGDLVLSLLGKRSNRDEQVEAYWKYPKERLVGRFLIGRPMLLIRDPELVNSLLIKDFNHMPNRGFQVNEDELLAKHLLNLRDGKWKSLRSKLSPIFTSGKLKAMHHQLLECSQVLVNLLEGYSGTDKDLDVREVMASFTTDVIGRCAFGLQMNAITDPESEFRKIGRALFAPSIRTRMVNNIRTAAPWMMKFMRRGASGSRRVQFFVSVFTETMKEREEGKVQAPDFVQLLLNLKKEQEKLGHQEASDKLVFDDNLMVSNAFVFFAAGFETTASTLSYCLFELARHPEVQDRLRKEVDRALGSGEPTFEAINDMPYLDQLISETLRMYPPATGLNREVSEPYTVPGTDLTLPKGLLVHVPAYSFHHDPQYFPQPDVFLPERFSEANRDNIVKGTYLPFGDGPRICIGKRFAQMEMKVAISALMKRFRFSLSERTQLPLEFDKRTIFLVPIGGLWLKVHPRD